MKSFFQLYHVENKLRSYKDCEANILILLLRKKQFVLYQKNTEECGISRMRFFTRAPGAYDISGGVDVLDRGIQISTKARVSTPEHVARSCVQRSTYESLCFALQQNFHDARTVHRSRYCEQSRCPCQRTGIYFYMFYNVF